MITIPLKSKLRLINDILNLISECKYLHNMIMLSRRSKFRISKNYVYKIIKLGS